MLIGLQNEKKQFKSQISNLQLEVAELQQKSRIQNIEVTGFPETKNENLIAVIGDIAKHIKVPFDPQDIHVVHRVDSKFARHRPIVVNFYSRQKKVEWVSMARKRRVIKTTDINSSLPPSNVYVNEHLCPAYKALFGKAKAAQKLSDVKFVWCSGGKIRAKKNEDSKPIVIQTDEDIVKFIGNIPPQTR